jgi:hypothetical protein
MKSRLRVFLAGACLSLAACTTAPVQEMSDARQSVDAARAAGAAEYAPSLLDGAERLLQRAAERLEVGAYAAARRAAHAAQDMAQEAREAALATAHEGAAP